MASSKLILTAIVSWSSIVYNSNSETVICQLTGTQCNCKEVMDSTESCSLHCSSIDVCKDTTLNCRAGDPCSITCQGYASCTDVIIQPNTATDVTITCDGTDSCKGMTASCGSGDCSVQCNTHDSCKEILSIHTVSASSFECNGVCDAKSIPSPFVATQTLNPTLFTSNTAPSSTSLHPTVSPDINDYIIKDEVEIRYIEHQSLSVICYVVIGVSTTIVICVCGIASALVYLNHKHTQQILMAATQTYAANINGTKKMNENNYDAYHQPPLHVQSSSFVMNPYQIPAIFNPVNTTYTAHNMTAISVNNDAMSHCEGTETNINRNISDIPALPYHKHRTSMHMTPSGYMDDEFITKEYKQNDEITPGMKPQSPGALTNNSNADSNINVKDTNDAELALLKLGENTAYDGRKDIDVQMDTETSNEISNTDDLSRELFATHSDSHSRNVSHDVVPPNRSPWYQYHQVGSLPVIMSNNYNHNKQQHRAQSALLIAKQQDQDPEPLQLPLLLNNNLIPPTEHSESTYDSNISDTMYPTDDETALSESLHGNDDDRSRLTHTKSMFSTESDWDELNDDDTYLEIKPLKESSTINTECESINTVEDHESETSVTKEGSGDSVILNHAYALMNILANEDSYHERKSSISFNV